jgi:hypothetical protein
MFMRTFSGLFAVLLIGCSSDPVPKNKVSQADAADKIECALQGVPDFQSDCAIERSEGTVLILRHSDGGFRRLTLESDGTIDTADGAEAVTVQTLKDGRAEIMIGDDRYRLPATL